MGIKGEYEMLIPGLVVMAIAILIMAGIPIITIIEDYKDYQNNKYDEWRKK